MALTTHIPLWVKSHYSFLEGASSPAELVEQAHAHGLPSIALTDRHGYYGLVEAYAKGRELGVQVICGAELGVRDDAGNTGRIVALARDRAGYGALSRLLTVGHAGQEKGVAEVQLGQLEALAEGAYLLCPEVAWLESLRRLAGTSAFALAARHLHPGERARERALRNRAESLGLRTVGAVETLYHCPTRKPLQDILACIRAGKVVYAAGRTLTANAEHALLSPAAMSHRFADAPELLAASIEIAEGCSFGLGQLDYRYPAESRPDGQSEQDWLRTLTYRGAARRYPDGITDAVRRQLERELDIIGDLQYGGYFLTMHEIVSFCRSEGILCQGRGSAANSAVCYCLGITAVDPVRMDLLFERFLSRERAEPPDIDLDIEHARREEVIQHVYRKYGRRRAAMVANVIRYRARSAVRDVGKALGIPPTELDTVARLLRHHDATLDARLLADAGLRTDQPLTRALVGLTAQLLDFPRHLSIHPGGFLLGAQPVDELVPVEPATMEGRTVIQWDKYDVEELGLFKVDLLGLGSLTCVHQCFELLREHEGLDIDMATVPHEDPATYEMISRGDTVGVFQIESRAQMAMLPRLQPRTFYDLVIEVAIVRPGPIQGGMVHPYLRRRKGEEREEYPHPCLIPVLKKTKGVAIFQEQVMKLAVVAADYTPGEADQLRRDMAAWRRSGRIDAHEVRLVSRMTDKGIPKEFAERVFQQIRGFGEYGFPESHAASFALIAYVTSWLRCHHPAVFVCGLLNAQPMGFYRPATLVEDAKRHGVKVLPIDIQKSAWDCTLERVPVAGGGSALALRMGLRYVKGLGLRERIPLEAATRPFESLEDITRKTRLSRRAMVALAESGALAPLGFGRRDALWAVRHSAELAKLPLRLGGGGPQLSFPLLGPSEQVAWDYRASQHSTRGHPMKTLRPWLEKTRRPTAMQLRALPDGRRVSYVGLVICRQRPGTASGVTFLTLEDETGFVNGVLWRDVFERHRTVAKTATLMGIDGTLQVAEGVTHLVADRIYVPDRALDAEAPRSRDFH